MSAIFSAKTTGNEAAALKRAANEMKPATDASTSRNGKPELRLKQAGAWFVANENFGRALEFLSDGAFRVFAWLCLRAEQPSGHVETTQKELATALSKSKRAVSSYVAELQQK